MVESAVAQAGAVEVAMVVAKMVEVVKETGVLRVVAVDGLEAEKEVVAAALVGSQVAVEVARAPVARDPVAMARAAMAAAMA